MWIQILGETQLKYVPRSMYRDFIRLSLFTFTVIVCPLTLCPFLVSCMSVSTYGEGRFEGSQFRS